MSTSKEDLQPETEQQIQLATPTDVDDDASQSSPQIKVDVQVQDHDPETQDPETQDDSVNQDPAQSELKALKDDNVDEDPAQSEPKDVPDAASSEITALKEEESIKQHVTEANSDNHIATESELKVLQDIDTDRTKLMKEAFNDKEIAYIANIRACCDAADNFDIFQLLAINIDKIGVLKGDELHKRNKAITSVKYILSAIKGILTGATQVIGISIIMVDFVREGLVKKYGSVEDALEIGICNSAHDEYEEDPEVAFYRFLLSVLAFLFSSFLGYFSMGHLLHIEKGMYKNMDHAKNLHWVNSIWLRVGFVINIIVSIISVYGSFVVIYFSDNALDMVLNSVALFFIVELDDILVNPEDYVKIEKYIEGKKDKFAVTKERHQGRCRQCFDNLTHCCGWLYALPFQILRYITVALCVVFPFVVAYCY